MRWRPLLLALSLLSGLCAGDTIPVSTTKGVAPALWPGAQVGMQIEVRIVPFQRLRGVSFNPLGQSFTFWPGRRSWKLKG